MPIHFRCQHCNARLSVSSRKVGARATCPKCGGKIVVPSAPVAPHAAPSAAATPSPPPATPPTAAADAPSAGMPSASGVAETDPGAADAAAVDVAIVSAAGLDAGPEPARPEKAAPEPARPEPASLESAPPDSAPPDDAPPEPDNSATGIEPAGPPQERGPKAAEPVGDKLPSAAADQQPAASQPVSAGDRLIPPASAAAVRPPADTVFAAGVLPSRQLPVVPDPTAADPFAQFIVYDEDDETELVYEDLEEEPELLGAWSPFDPAKVAVRREVLYLQGVLLIAVAVISFGLGVLFGGRAGNPLQTSAGPQPCLISGRVVLQTSGGDVIPDTGAAVIALSQNVRPESRLEILGLRPQDPVLPDDHPTIQAIRSLDGDFVRAGADGSFRLQVSDRGEYFLLVISAARRAAPELPRPVLAQLGRYFELLPDLFGGHDVRWRAETVRSDRQVNIVF